MAELDVVWRGRLSTHGCMRAWSQRGVQQSFPSCTSFKVGTWWLTSRNRSPKTKKRVSWEKQCPELCLAGSRVLSLAVPRVAVAARAVPSLPLPALAPLLPPWQDTRHLLPQRDPAARGSALEASRASGSSRARRRDKEVRGDGEPALGLRVPKFGSSHAQGWHPGESWRGWEVRGSCTPLSHRLSQPCAHPAAALCSPCISSPLQWCPRDLQVGLRWAQGSGQRGAAGMWHHRAKGAHHRGALALGPSALKQPQPWKWWFEGAPGWLGQPWPDSCPAPSPILARHRELVAGPGAGMGEEASAPHREVENGPEQAAQ